MHPITPPLDDGKPLARFAGHGRDVSVAVVGSARRHMLLYALALASLTIATSVGSFTGNMPDFDVLGTYGFYILVAFWIGGCGFAVFRLLWLGAVERHPAPTREFFASFGRFFGDADRMANGFNGIAALMIFISGFSVLKGAIGIIAPFSWMSRWRTWTAGCISGERRMNGCGRCSKIRARSSPSTLPTISGSWR